MARKAKDALQLEEAQPSAEAISRAVRGGEKALYAYADFEIESGGIKVLFKEGEKFFPALGWERAPQMDELLSGSKHKNGARTGIAFSYMGKVINPNAKPEERQRQALTVVLPLEER